MKALTSSREARRVRARRGKARRGEWASFFFFAKSHFQEPGLSIYRQGGFRNPGQKKGRWHARITRSRASRRTRGARRRRGRARTRRKWPRMARRRGRPWRVVRLRVALARVALRGLGVGASRCRVAWRGLQSCRLRLVGSSRIRPKSTSTVWGRWFFVRFVTTRGALS